MDVIPAQAGIHFSVDMLEYNAWHNFVHHQLFLKSGVYII